MSELTLLVRKVSWLLVGGERHVTDEWTTEILSSDPADVVRYLVKEGHTTPSSDEYAEDLTWTSVPYQIDGTDVWNQWTVQRHEVPDAQWRAVWELMVARQQSSATTKRGTMATALRGAEFTVQFSENGRTATVSGGGQAVTVESVIEEMDVRIDTHGTWPAMYMASLAQAEEYARHNPCQVAPLDGAVTVRWCLPGGSADRFFVDLADVMASTAG